MGQQSYPVKSCNQGMQLGRENGQFRHNRAIKGVTGNENFTKRNNWDPNQFFSTNFGGKLSLMFDPVFPFFPEPLRCCYIFIHAPPAAAVTLEPCALNAEFQHFVSGKRCNYRHYKSIACYTEISFLSFYFQPKNWDFFWVFSCETQIP